MALNYSELADLWIEGREMPSFKASIRGKNLDAHKVTLREMCYRMQEAALDGKKKELMEMLEFCFV